MHTHTHIHNTILNVCLHTHLDGYVSHMHIHPWSTCNHTHTHIYIYIYIYICTHIYTHNTILYTQCMSAHTHMDISSASPPHTFTPMVNSQPHTYTQTHTHIFIYIYINMYTSNLMYYHTIGLQYHNDNKKHEKQINAEMKDEFTEHNENYYKIIHSKQRPCK